MTCRLCSGAGAFVGFSWPGHPFSTNAGRDLEEREERKVLEELSVAPPPLGPAVDVLKSPCPCVCVP